MTSIRGHLEKSEAEKRAFCDLPIQPFLEQPRVTSNRARPRFRTRPLTGSSPGPALEIVNKLMEGDLFYYVPSQDKRLHRNV